jgi:hypothetical protein
MELKVISAAGIIPHHPANPLHGVESETGFEYKIDTSDESITWS